jgi:hypothetical protein
MNLGATKKREMYILGGLLLVGGYLFYSNVLSGPSSPEPSRPSRAAAPGVAKTSKKGPVFTDRASDAETPTSSRRSAGSVRTSEEFRPSMKHRPEEHLDPMSIDPTLHKELLAKVQAVTIEGGRRNLFSIGTPPLPPEPVVAVKGPTQTAKMIGPEPPPPPPPKPAEPPPPPINLKYYGYSSARGDNRKHAFFLDGDDILVAAEGETVKKRYRVVRIGVNSVVMEDTQFKHEQTLPLQEEIAG